MQRTSRSKHTPRRNTFLPFPTFYPFFENGPTQQPDLPVMSPARQKTQTDTELPGQNQSIKNDLLASTAKGLHPGIPRISPSQAWFTVFRVLTLVLFLKTTLKITVGCMSMHSLSLRLKVYHPKTSTHSLTPDRRRQTQTTTHADRQTRTHTGHRRTQKHNMEEQENT